MNHTNAKYNKDPMITIIYKAKIDVTKMSFVPLDPANRLCRNTKTSKGRHTDHTGR